eukprot:6861642-Ditylum_brightwellii.AAC.1
MEAASKHYSGSSGESSSSSDSGSSSGSDSGSNSRSNSGSNNGSNSAATLVSHGLFCDYYYAGVEAMLEPWAALPVMQRPSVPGGGCIMEELAAVCTLSSSIFALLALLHK